MSDVCSHEWSEEWDAGLVRSCGLVADKMKRQCDHCWKVKTPYRRWRCETCMGQSVPPEMIERAVDWLETENFAFGDSELTCEKCDRLLTPESGTHMMKVSGFEGWHTLCNLCADGEEHSG